jgi:hypothetical protein
VKEWPICDRKRLWHINFETVVFGPFQALNHAFPDCGAVNAMTKFICAMESPILENEKLLAGIPEACRESPCVRRALLEVQVRRATIHALRNSATVKRDGDFFEVEIYSDEDRRSRDKLTSKRKVRVPTPEPNEPAEINIARQVVADWQGIPTC